MKVDKRGITIGALLAAIPTLGAAWTFATIAAEHVINPHLAEARMRVEMMCAWARAADARDRAQVENTAAICITVGAPCKPAPEIPPNPLLDKCGE